MEKGDFRWSPLLFGMITSKYPHPLWGHPFPPIGSVNFSFFKDVNPIFEMVVRWEFSFLD